mgnify:CR=1 FL=1
MLRFDVPAQFLSEIKTAPFYATPVVCSVLTIPFGLHVNDDSQVCTEEDEPIEHKLVTKSIESAQKKVEARNFTIRKQVLEYDNVMNQQREVIYSQRRKILQQANLRDTIMEMVHKVVDRTMAM